MPIKTDYKYIKFEWNDSEDYKRWECFNKKTENLLAWINIYNRKHKSIEIQYDPDCEFDELCTRDIADFLAQLNRQKNVRDKHKKS